MISKDNKESTIINHYYDDWFKLFCKDYVNKLISKQCGLLNSDFYNEFENSLLNKLVSLFGAFINEDKKNQALENNPLLFIAYNELDNKEKIELIEDYKDKVLSKGKECFDEKYPLYKKEIERVCEQFLINTSLLIDRIVANKKIIEDKFFNGNQIECINNIFIVGDSHNNLNSTTIINTNIGKFVYHPRDCRIDKWFNDIVNKYFINEIYIPKIICVNNEYCFNEFVENKPSSTISETKKYYYNLGCLLAILNAFGSTDFHFENIMVKDGLLPVVIDIETIIKGKRENYFDISGFNEDLNNSTLTMMFLPYLLGDNFEASILFNSTDSNISMPVINGSKQNVLGFINEFYDGFSHMYKKLVDIKDDLLRSLDELNDIDIRIIIRPTKNYYAMRNRLYGVPAFYISLQNRKEIINKTVAELSVIKNEKLEKVINGEMYSLVNGDIPYLFNKANSTNLFIGNEFEVDNYLLLSPTECTKQKLNSLNNKEYEFEKRLIETCIKNANIELDKPLYLEYDENIKIDKSEISPNIEEIYKLLEDSLIITNNDNKGWLIQDKFGNYEFENMNLGTGISGLVLFLTSYMQYKKQGEYYDRANKLLDICLKKIFSYIDNLLTIKKEFQNTTHFGMEDGLGGIMIALDSAYKYNNLASDYISRLFKFIINFDISNYWDTSFETGILGLVIAISRINNINNDDKQKILIMFKDKLVGLCNLDIDDNIRINIALAFKILKKVNSSLINDDLYNSLINKLNENNNSIVYEIKKLYLLDINISKNISVDKLWTDRLYYGKAMLIDYFIEHNDYNSAISIANNMINRKNNNGYFIMTKRNIKPRNILSLYYGVLGIGYELIKISNKILQ